MIEQGEAAARRLMRKASSLYYVEGLKQREIADRLHLSRPKVSRLLQQARDEGIVQISIASDDETFTELESKLESLYGLEEVLITASPLPSRDGGSDALKQQVGRASAHYLRRSVSDGETLGVTWGTTLQAMMSALQPISMTDVHVVQTLGGVGPPEAEAHAADLSRRLAQLLGGQLTALPTPGIVDSTSARDVLISDRHVKAALELFPRITTAYVGVGAIDTNPIFADDPTVRDTVYDELVDSNAVGDIALRFFDGDGKSLRTSLDERLIGITLEQLSKVERVVGVAGGPQKVDAILGALRGGLIDVLITDRVTATKLSRRAE